MSISEALSFGATQGRPDVWGALFDTSTINKYEYEKTPSKIWKAIRKSLEALLIVATATSAVTIPSNVVPNTDEIMRMLQKPKPPSSEEMQRYAKMMLEKIGENEYCVINAQNGSVTMSRVGEKGLKTVVYKDDGEVKIYTDYGPNGADGKLGTGDTIKGEINILGLGLRLDTIKASNDGKPLSDQDFYNGLLPYMQNKCTTVLPSDFKI